jgi:two-component system chemotaxis response regulator CheB
MNPPAKIKVLIVDDSAVVRQVLTKLLSKDPDIEVVGAACDPYVARDLILELKPDVLTLDIEMPRMDGLTFLRILQQHRPMPVIIISALTPEGSKIALDAMAAGAVEVIEKPAPADRLLASIKAAATAQVANCLQNPPAAEPIPGISCAKSDFHPRQLILIGASTGGTEAIRSVLMRLPPGLPGICVVQHIPRVFSKAFAQRLAQSCRFDVREAADGDRLLPGLALIAPGDYHMRLRFDQDGYRVHLDQSPPLHHTRPAVDHLFESAAPIAGPHAVAALLTGMGRDGAAGMLKLAQAGAATIAQDERSCVVYGMPKAAVDLGAARQVLPLARIPEALCHALSARDDAGLPRTALPSTLPANCPVAS